MKTILQTLLLCVFCITNIPAYAQSFNLDNASSNVIRFKDIPISGNIEVMTEQLQKKGYVLDELDNYVAILKGNFANEDCEIVLYATPITKQMHTVTVSFSKKSSWYSLKTEYLKIKDLITEKYNVSPNSTEKFYTPYYEGDGYEMQALRNDKCAYFSTFKIGNDKIGVYIMENKVLLLYQSFYGNSLNEKEENQRVMYDL